MNINGSAEVKCPNCEQPVVLLFADMDFGEVQSVERDDELANFYKASGKFTCDSCDVVLPAVEISVWESPAGKLDKAEMKFDGLNTDISDLVDMEYTGHGAE